MDPLRDYIAPRSLADMETEVIRRGGSFDVPFEVSRPARPQRKQKKEKR